MTHDELLKKVLASEKTSLEWALKAVIELHKSRPSLFDDLECEECTGNEEINESIAYPCQTIEAIKKELNG